MKDFINILLVLSLFAITTMIIHTPTLEDIVKAMYLIVVFPLLGFLLGAKIYNEY